MARASVDLPDPDSPTNPSVSPARSSKPMSSSAVTGPNRTLKARTDNKGSA